MLTDTEKQGCEELLDILSKEEVLQLATTVTGGLTGFRTKAEAIQAICRYTQTPRDLLRRRKLKKEYLQKYIYSIDKNAGTNNPETLCKDKAELVKRVLTHWNSNIQESDELMDYDEDYETAQASVPGVTIVLQQSFYLSPNPADGQPQQNNEYELALEFSKWFYSLLNNSTAQINDFGEQHFFENCTLGVMYSQSGSEMCHTDQFKGSGPICLKLKELVMQGIRFNPNLEMSGLRGIADPHGMRMIQVCGTLHQGDRVIGVFEQLFGLARVEHMENNWKIKCSKLRLRSEANVTSMPQLSGANCLSIQELQ